MTLRRWAWVCALGVLLATGWWFFRPANRAGADVDRARLAVQARPRDPAAWLALGDAQVALDQVPGAEHAFRTSIELADANPNAQRTRALARVRLGFLKYAQGRDDEARRWLTEARSLGAEAPLLDETLAQLSTDPSPDFPPPQAPSRVPPAQPEAMPGRPDAGFELDAATTTPPQTQARPRAAADVRGDGDDSCVLTLDRRTSGALYARVWLNGVEVILLVDTGATITLLNRSAADRARVAERPGRFQGHTANGPMEASVGWIDRVDLGDRTIEGARIAVCDECLAGVAEGLFGVDLQTRFDVQVDVVAGQLLFADCD